MALLPRLAAPLLAAAPLLLAGCPPPAEEEALVAELKARLAERERRLAAYRIAGVVEDGGGAAHFRFAFRAPDRMRGTVGPPVDRTLAFDGRTLFLREGADGPVRAEPLGGQPRAAVAARLHALFHAFVSEGYRVPLLSPRALRARRTAHPLAAEAVEVVTTAQAPGEPPVRATYVLRWPALDFLHKRLEGAALPVEVRVEAEACDAALGVCVPRAWTQWSGAQRVATVRLSEVALGTSLPLEAFSLGAPGEAAARPQSD